MSQLILTIDPAIDNKKHVNIALYRDNRHVGWATMTDEEIRDFTWLFTQIIKEQKGNPPHPSSNATSSRYSEISNIYYSSNLGYTHDAISKRIRKAYDEGWSDEQIKSDIKELSNARDEDEHFIQTGHY